MLLIVAYTWAQSVAHRDVIWFCDNIGAVHSLAGGVARAQDLQVLVSITRSVFSRLRSRWWIEWVPSEASVSDGLSRLGPADPWSPAHGLAPEALALPRGLGRLNGSWDFYYAELAAHFAAAAA